MDQNGNNNPNQFVCTGDCLNCRKQPGERREQWQYCAAQFTYNTMKMLGDVQEQMMAMQDTIDNLTDKIEAIQNSEATVFDPNLGQNLGHDIAQEGDGVI